MGLRKTFKTDRLLGVHCSAAGGVANAPLIAAELRTNALQLFTGPNQQWRAPRLTKSDIAGFLANMKDGGIRAAMAHACYLINLAAPDDEIFEKSISAMKGEVDRADALCIPWVIVHPGSHKGRGLEWGLYRIAEAISEILAATKGARAGIALETTAGQGNSIGHEFKEIGEIMRLAGDDARIAACFDTCHVFAAGYELRTKKGYADTWDEFDRTVGIQRLVAMHLNDSKGELASRIDRHEHIGKGKIGLAGFRLIMNDARLEKIPMLLETPKEGNAIRRDTRNLSTLRKLVS